MGTMPIHKLALKISIPMVISMISIALYQIVDTIFISKISGDALTTISLCLPVISLITSIGLGTSVGVNSILARTLGEKDNVKSKKIILNGILIMFVSWVIISLCSLLGLKYFFEFFSNSKVIQDLGYKYLIIISVISVGSLFQILFEKILEAYGKAKLSMMIQLCGAIINLILDPILIFGIGFIPTFGIKGAAVATISGQICGMVLGLIFILKENIINFNDFKLIKIEKNIIKEIYEIGFPTIILEAAGSFIILILNKILIAFSESAVSVWGIYTQLQKFIMIIIYGFNYGMIPIVAYNYGAKNKQRVMQAISFFIKLAVGVTFAGMMLFLLIPKILVSIYNVDKNVIDIAILAFRILSVGFIFAGISLVKSAFFQALGNGTYSLIINVSRKIIFVIPLIFILKKFIGIYSIWISFVIAEIITMIIANILFKKIVKNTIEKIE